MLAEDRNKIISEKLQAFDQLPEGFDFSSDAVWQQLETKLLQQKKPSGFRLYVKYLVAASIILAISLMAVLLIRKQVPPALTNIASKERQLPIKAGLKLIVDAKIEPTKKELRNYSSTKKSPIVLPVATTIAAEPILSASEPNQNLMQQPASETTATITSTVVATMKEKKLPIIKNRLPIIHINELSRAPEPIYTKSSNKNMYLNEVEEAVLPAEHPKPWWQPKPKTANPIISLTDNQ